MRSTSHIAGAILVAASTTIATLGAAVGSPAVQAADFAFQTDLVGPAGSEAFGETVLVLSNGNYVVTDPQWDDGATADVGAVYLYDGNTNNVIATLTGTTSNDRVGSEGVVEVGTSDFVVASQSWDDTATSIVNAGAATWVDGTTGIDGPVTQANSLFGSIHFDLIGTNGVVALTNGNYVVSSSSWTDPAGPTVDVGAATWGNGAGGTVGPVTTANSLYGTTEEDLIGESGITALANGNYVVTSESWDRTTPSAIANVGAATWGNGATGTAGAVTTGNSLYGTSASSWVGSDGVVALANGNYVVVSRLWDNPVGPAADAGAVTWGNGGGGTVGGVTASNSTVGSSTNDLVGSGGVAALTNATFVVSSPNWDRTSPSVIVDAGATTWRNGSAPDTGVVAVGNSLHGTAAGDQVGLNGVAALSNGNFVVASSQWDNPAGAGILHGAATWASGSTGTPIGAVSAANSMVGSAGGDKVGSGGTTALTNGNYVVSSPDLNPPVSVGIREGAATWGNGTTGTAGVVDITNSLHGGSGSDKVSSGGVVALTNGNYVVVSPDWDNGAVPDAGAVTWGDGATGSTGLVAPANSLHGATFDAVGNGGVTAIDTGDYVVISTLWDNPTGPVLDAGAATIGDGATGIVGTPPASGSAFGTPPGTVQSPGSTLTSGAAVPVPTFQDRVLLIQLDDAAPTFDGAPLDVNVEVASGTTSAVVTYPLPPASDDTATPVVSCVPASGTAFAVGDTSVTCTATDIVGNTAMVSFVVHVVELAAIEPTDPARFLDTRDEATIDGLFSDVGRVAAGEVLKVKIAGRGEVPADAEGVVANLAVIFPDSAGFATMFPCSATPPGASNLNYAVGDISANNTVVALNNNGEVCIFSQSGADYLLDVNGYLPAGSPVVTSNPARFLDTRNEETVDGQFVNLGRVQADAMIEVKIAGRNGIPNHAAAAIVNATVVAPSGPGFATVYPCGPRPGTSTLNYALGEIVPNGAVTKLSADGTVCIYSSAAAHLLLDVSGYVETGIDSLATTAPARFWETRNESTIDGQQLATGRLAAMGEFEVEVTGRNGIPATATAAILNVVVIRPDGAGFITLYACGERPQTSALNYSAGGVNRANNALTKLSSDGTVCVFTMSEADIIVDVSGYLT